MANKSKSVKLDLKQAEDRKKFVEVLTENNGRLLITREICGVSKATLFRYRKKFPEFGAAVNEAKSLQVDYVEGKLFDLIDKNNVNAIIFFLKTRGRDRGYGEKYVPEIKPEEKEHKVSNKAARILGGVKTAIIKALKKRGTFDNGLSFQIELAAMLYTKLQLMKTEIFDINHHTIIIEKSREGNNREVVSPIETQFKQYITATQAALRGLGLNADAKQQIATDDGFDNFLKDFEEDNK